MAEDFHALVESCRCENYHQAANKPLSTSGGVLSFLNAVGFCLLFAHKKLELPDLWSISGGDTWHWKDELPAERKIYYGKVYQGKPGFVALDMLPAFYALSPIAECGGDRFELYRRGLLSADANRLAGAVMAKGPLHTRALRRECGMAGKPHKHRFSRALAEAEAKFLLVKTDTTSSTRSHYSYIWDSFTRFLPEFAEEGLFLSPEQAAASLLPRYVETVVATTPSNCAYLFSLNETFVSYVFDSLIEQGILAHYMDHIVHPEFLTLLEGHKEQVPDEQKSDS